MPLSVEDLREHLSYSAWATQLLLQAAQQLTETELHRDFQTADHSIADTLAHTFAADRLWLRRLRGEPFRPPLVSERDHRLDVLTEEWPELYRQWDGWLAGLDDTAVAADFSYQDNEGNAHPQPVWKLAMHVVNHGTHHRGQVSGFLRALGHTPPALDLTAYYREQRSSAMEAGS